MQSQQLFVVYFESANYCGYGEHCLVWAVDEDDALSNEALSEYVESFYREQDEDQWVEEHGDDCDPDEVMWACIKEVVPLVGSEFEKYMEDPSQASFYPIVN